MESCQPIKRLNDKNAIKNQASLSHYCSIVTSCDTTELPFNFSDHLEGNRDHTRGADKSLARPERKKATATEDFEFHISYL